MRGKSAVLGVAAALALSSVAIGSAHATPCTSSLQTLMSLTGSCTAGDLSFSNFSYSNSTTVTLGNQYYRLNSASDVPVGVKGSPEAGLGFGIGVSWNSAQKSKTTDVKLKYDVAATGNNLIEDAAISFKGTTGSFSITPSGQLITKKFGTIADTETIRYKTSGGKFKTTQVVAKTPSKSVDAALGAAVKSISVTQEFVLHASQTGLHNALGTFTDEFSTKKVSAVPEPASLGLLGIGLAGLGLLGRKRRKTA